jgi:hypothetical protein
MSLPPPGANPTRQRGRSRGQTQKIPTVGKFHGVPPGRHQRYPNPRASERSLEFWLWHLADVAMTSGDIRFRLTANDCSYAGQRAETTERSPRVSNAFNRP